MKKLIVVCLLIIGSVVALNAQNKWKGFFRPVENDLFTNPNVMAFRGVDTTKTSVWLFKFDTEITAVQLLYDKVEKKWRSSPLSSAGPGIGYRHYIQYNGKPYCNFGVNLLALVGYDWSEISFASISPVVTITFMDFVNVGGGYNFMENAPLIVMGAIIKF